MFAEIIITSILNPPEEKFLYCHEALKMPHTMNKKAPLLKQLWKKYEALKFSNTFPIEKPYNFDKYKSLQLTNTQTALFLSWC